MSSQSILFVGGGSIGHIAPSIAVARELLRMRPDTSVHFICSSRPTDAQYIERQGFVAIPIVSPRLSWAFPWQFWKAYRLAHSLLRELKPSAVFSKGGYVSVPVCLAAWRQKIPIILHESDVVSGRANRIVGWWAQTICLGFGNATTNGRRHSTGNPVDARLLEGVRERGLAISGLSGQRPILLVLGGSQGSQALNQAIERHLPSLLTFVDIVHVTGPSKQSVMLSTPGYWQIPFAFEELPHLYAIADIAISRAGANTIAELAGNGVPAILVPLRGVGHDHQEYNARFVAMAGACVVLQETDVDRELTEQVRAALAPDRRAAMSDAIRRLHRPDAARQIAELIPSSLA